MKWQKSFKVSKKINENKIFYLMVRWDSGRGESGDKERFHEHNLSPWEDSEAHQALTRMDRRGDSFSTVVIMKAKVSKLSHRIHQFVRP